MYTRILSYRNSHLTKTIYKNSIINLPIYNSLALQLKYGFITITKSKNIWFDNILVSDQNDESFSQQQMASFAVNAQRAIQQYPYVYIPITLIRNYEKSTLGKQLTADLIAVRCISNIPSKDLNAAFQFLLPQKAKQYSIELQNNQTGRAVFSGYFQDKLSILLKHVNEKELNISKRIYYLSIINQLSITILTTELIKNIDYSTFAQEETGVLNAMYLVILKKHKLPLHQNMFSQVEKKLTDHQLQAKWKLKIAKILFTLPYFMKMYSPKLIDLAIRSLKQNISTMTNYELLQCIRLIYNYTSNESKSFSSAILQHIIKLNQRNQQNNCDHLMLLVMKVIKYCQVLKVPTHTLILEFTNNTHKYRQVLQKGLIPEGLFITVLFLWTKQKLSPQLIAYMKTHVVNRLQYFQTSQEINEQQLIRFCRLVVKYYWHFNLQEQNKIRTSFVSLTPKIQNNKHILYECLTVILQTNQLIPMNNSENIAEIVVKYFQKICRRNKIGQLIIESNLNEIVYLVNRCSKTKLAINEINVPSIGQYQFSADQILQLSTLQNLMEYLLTRNIEDVKHTVLLIIPSLQYYLHSRRFSYKITLHTIQLLVKIQYNDKDIYRHLEKALYQIMQKFSDFIINTNAMHFLKQNLIKKKYASKSLENLVIHSIQSPNKWQEFRKQFIRQQRQYWKNQNYKKKREREANQNINQYGFKH